MLVFVVSGNPFAPAEGSQAVSAPPLPSSWGSGQDASGPPAAATDGRETSPNGGFVQPQPFSSSASTRPGGSAGGAVPGGALEEDNDSCVVCMAAPVQAGFLHGSRFVDVVVVCMLVYPFLSSPVQAGLMLQGSRGVYVLVRCMLHC